MGSVWASHELIHTHVHACTHAAITYNHLDTCHAELSPQLSQDKWRLPIKLSTHARWRCSFARCLRRLLLLLFFLPHTLSNSINSTHILLWLHHMQHTLQKDTLTHTEWTVERRSLNRPDQRFQLDGLLSCQIKSATKMCFFMPHFVLHAENTSACFF